MVWFELVWFGMVSLGLILIFITKLLSKQKCLCHYSSRVEPGIICKVDATQLKLILVKPFRRPSSRLTVSAWVSPSSTPACVMLGWSWDGVLPKVSQNGAKIRKWQPKLWPCLNLALTLSWHYLGPALSIPCLDHALTLPTYL